MVGSIKETELIYKNKIINMDKSKFYDILFNRDEGIGYQTDCGIPGEPGFHKKNKVIVHKGDQDEYNFNFHFYCINPIHPTIDHDPQPDEELKPRIKIANVTSFRNFAIEFDEDSLEEQKRKLKIAKPPVSAVIFSGSKSLHTPIALEEGVTQEEYSAIFEAIKVTLAKYDLKLDKQCKNANRLTRAPFEIRHNTTVEQKLLGSRGRIPNQQLFDWFETNGVNWKDYIYKPKESTHEYNGIGDADDELRWLAAVGSCQHFNGDYASADQWQPWLFELGKWSKAYGLEEATAIMWANRDYTHPDRTAIDTGIKNGYKYGKLSPRTLNKPRQVEMVDDMFDSLLDMVVEEKPNRPQIPYDNHINNWWIIGSDIYLRYANRELEKQTVQGFNARFPQKEINYTMIPNKRSGMGYYPDYFGTNDEPLDGNKYNAFKKPDVVIEKGEWPMTMILLKHIFGNQLELGLEYYWVKRHRPAQALPALCLVGSEDAGKTTIGDHQEMCFSNSVSIGIKTLEGSDSAYLFGKQDIIIEESNAGGSNRNSNPDAILSDIKRMVTQCGGEISVKNLHKDTAPKPYFAKVMMFTNDRSPIKMTGEATRFWVIDLKTPEKHEEFVEKLKAEVGHFLWYLDNEFTPSRLSSKERLWFNPKEYWTIAKEFAMKDSSTKESRAIKESLQTWFDETGEEYCYFDLKSLKDYIKLITDFDIHKGTLKDCLLDDLKWGDAATRKAVPDHLTNTEKCPNSPWDVRKMSYWKISSELKPAEELNGMEKLLDL